MTEGGKEQGGEGWSGGRDEEKKERRQKREGDREWDVSREQGVQAERGNEG